MVTLLCGRVVSKGAIRLLRMWLASVGCVLGIAITKANAECNGGSFTINLHK